MSVELSPAGHLDFHRPLTQIVKCTLSVLNPNHQPVAFKVKTTAPKNFCVRPNSGRIEPGERVEVQVLLQGLREEPAPDFKCRDKFLVQSALITPDRELKALSELWSAIEADAKSGKNDVIHEQKIRCVYLPPSEDGSNGADTSGTHATPPVGGDASFLAAMAGGNGTPSKYETVRGLPPVDTSDSPQAATSSLNGGRESPVPQTAMEREPSKDLQQQSSSILPSSFAELKNTASNAVSSAAAAVTSSTSAASTTSGSSALEKELQAAKSEIERLKKLLQQKEQEVSSGLRQRTTAPVTSRGGDSESKGMAGMATAVQMQDGGLPLQTVAILCAGVFVVTWLFF